MPFWYGDYLIPGLDGYTPEPTYTPPSDPTRPRRPRDPSNPGTRPDGTPTNRALRNMIPDSTKYFESINPMYTQAQPFDAFAPMRMYQRYQDTGRLPSMGSPGAPSAPSAPSASGGSGLPTGYSTGGGK